MLQHLRPAKYLTLLKNPLDLIRTKKVLQVNPTIEAVRKEPDHLKIFVYDYDSKEVKEQEVQNVAECYKYLDSAKVSWINIDGLRKSEIEAIGEHFGIHPLITEDI